MEFAVLVKVVPASESARFDPVRKTIRRDEGELFVNPFDQRAIRVALDLRRPGETVTVLSMGPPSTASAVQETLGLGVDRAVLVSDPALAGSDSLVTARVLARVLSERPAGLVLAGKWSTDSETGQVPAELAELLDRPLVSAARALRRDPEGETFEATVETETGSARAVFSAPAVVSVGEKIAKPAKPRADGTPAAGAGSLERIDAALLGFAASEVGLLGSPTVVGNLMDHAAHRRPILFDAGPVDARVHAALAVLAPRLRSVRPAAVPAGGSTRPGPPSGTALVLAFDARGDLDRGALALLSELRRALPALAVTALLAGASPVPDDVARVARAGAESLVQFPRASGATARTVAVAFDDLLERVPDVATVVFVSHAFGREVAGRLAARRGLGLTGDAVSFSPGPAGNVRFVKPALGGGLLAEIATRTRPALATVRPGGFVLGDLPPARPIPSSEGPAVAEDRSLRWVGRDDDPPDGLADPEAAEVVISVGVGAVESLAVIRELAGRWRAAVVGTRRVVDAGHLPLSRQVGLTGRWVAPRLGLLLGVRGSPNHLIAWRRAGVLLAVNPDPTAPVFAGVDVGIVGRCEDVLPWLADELPRVLAG
ncbi:MAG TPA: FAD-binding protein [Thermoplasmata archaeon]|nr:FAD-binding protein [Thermoplasmata archaeon]